MHVFPERFKKTHIFSDADARLKLLVAAGLLIMILSYRGFLFPLVVSAVSLILCIRMKVPMKILILRFSEPAFVAIVLVLLKFFFSGRAALFTINLFGLVIVGHTDGLIEGLMIATRIIGAVSVIALLGFATPFNDVLSGLSWFRIPKGLIEILMFAYRYIFVLLEDAQVIYNAQKNRLGYSSIRRGLSSCGILAGSLVLRAFDHSQNSTTAMVQRGYDGNMPLLAHKPFNVAEVAISIFFLLVMGVLWKL
ncbi:MAG TPA: cobalt ECF transporter T component CbiQ [Nitrospiraceae bacterium]|jgi:cobalt/nickel transport system permease protein|nr:cobalt ECF transporter T component CbiQ [Nitrospiraceae bacterium]